MVFDLDPGLPAAVGELELLPCGSARNSKKAWDLIPKTSGSKGIQIYAPLNTPVDFDTTKTLSTLSADARVRAPRARRLAHEYPIAKKGKVFIDLEPERQVEDNRRRVLLEGPLEADRFDSAALEKLRMLQGRRSLEPGIEAAYVLRPVEEHGDLFEKVATARQKVPSEVKKALAGLVERAT